MRGILRELSQYYGNTEDGNQKLNRYFGLKQSDGWEIHREFLLMIRAKIAEEMLSRRFMELDKEEKDAKQRAYVYTDEIIRFLLNPLELAIKRADFIRGFNNRMGATQREK